MKGIHLQQTETPNTWRITRVADRKVLAYVAVAEKHASVNLNVVGLKEGTPQHFNVANLWEATNLVTAIWSEGEVSPTKTEA